MPRDPPGAHLLFVALERGDHPFQLVGDVELVRVEEDEDQVGARREPGRDRDKVVTALYALLLAGEHAGRVDERDLIQKPRVARRGLKPRQKRRPERREPRPRHVRLDDDRVAGRAAFVGAGVDDHKLVRRRFRADVRAAVILPPQQVSDERGFAGRVGAAHEDGGARGKVGGGEGGAAVKGREFVSVLHRFHLNNEGFGGEGRLNWGEAAVDAPGRARARLFFFLFFSPRHLTPLRNRWISGLQRRTRPP